MTHDASASGPSPEPDGPDRGTAAESGSPRPWWKTALVWGERLLTVAVLAFVAVRLGPQVGALTGVAPSLGGAPAFTMTTLDGRAIRSEDLRGKVVVVNFWATWCGPCRLEMPALQALAEKHEGRDVVVLGLSVDAGASPVRAFLDERGITYPVGMASNAQRRAFGGIRGIPTTLIIDADGVLRHRVVGYFAPPAMNAAVARLAGRATDPGAVEP